MRWFRKQNLCCNAAWGLILGCALLLATPAMAVDEAMMKRMEALIQQQQRQIEAQAQAIEKLQQQVEKLREVRPEIPRIRRVVVFEGEPADDGSGPNAAPETEAEQDKPQITCHGLVDRDDARVRLERRHIELADRTALADDRPRLDDVAIGHRRAGQ